MRSTKWFSDEELMSALEGLGGELVQPEKGSWRLALSHHPGLEVEIRQSNQSGLLFRAPLSRPRSFWTLLGLNGGIPGTTRFALPPGEAFPLLLAEIPLDDTGDWMAWGRASLAGFEEAISRLDQGAKGKIGAGQTERTHPGLPDESAPPSTPDLSTPEAAESKDGRGSGTDRTPPREEEVEPPVESEEALLARLCEEAGWRATPREDGSATLNLAITPEAGPCRAELRRNKDAGSQLRIQIAEIDTPLREARKALGHLLMSASGSVRLARATVERTNGSSRLFFEVGLTWPPRPVEIDHAAAALSVVDHLCGREAEALQNQDLASLYLKMRGCAPRPAPHPTCRSHQQRRRNTPWLLPQPAN